jgi:hypothetical protein
MKMKWETGLKELDYWKGEEISFEGKELPGRMIELPVIIR